MYRPTGVGAGVVGHLDWPTAFFFAPGQSIHFEDFQSAAYLPGLQTVHGRPVPSENIPGGQAPHPFGSAARLFVPVPAGHFKQPAPLPLAYLPGPHWPHSAWLLAPALVPVPSKQLVHEEEPAVVENLPGAQA